MSSYDTVADFGALYDEVPAYIARKDVAFYVAEADRHARSAGTVLDLGCGTGRLLLPLVRAGHRVFGVDRSPAMLRRCAEKLAREPAEVRSRAGLLEGDVREFEVPRSGFGLAIAPFRILQHLTTVDDQLHCLATVRRHLAPNGRFAFDVFNPNFALMAKDRSAETEDTPERQLPDGRFFRRAFKVLRVHWVEQVNDVELIYYVRAGGGGEVTRVVQAFSMRWYNVPELEHLLVRAGFTVEATYGDFDRSPLRDGTAEIVVVARKN